MIVHDLKVNALCSEITFHSFQPQIAPGPGHYPCVFTPIVVVICRRWFIGQPLCNDEVLGVVFVGRVGSCRMYWGTPGAYFTPPFDRSVTCRPYLQTVGLGLSPQYVASVFIGIRGVLVLKKHGHKVHVYYSLLDPSMSLVEFIYTFFVQFLLLNIFRDFL